MKFEDLEVWKKAVAMCVEVFQTLSDLKDFGFRDQITRSALSVPSNIAEGIERGSDNEVIRFCRIARGSCGELRTQVFIGMEIGYISLAQGNSWISKTVELSAMLSGLIKHRQRNKDE